MQQIDCLSELVRAVRPHNHTLRLLVQHLEMFIPIPEVDLITKHQQVCEGQAHWCHHVDLADTGLTIEAGPKEELRLKFIPKGWHHQ